MVQVVAGVTVYGIVVAQHAVSAPSQALPA